MNFSAGNRIVMEKLKSQNDRYHRRKLSQIRHSKIKQQPIPPKIQNRKRYFQQQQRRQQIEKQNAFLLDKMNRILDKKFDFVALYPNSKLKCVKSKNTERSEDYQNIKQRVNNQKSVYSQEKFDQSWRETQRYKKSIARYKLKHSIEHEYRSSNLDYKQNEDKSKQKSQIIIQNNLNASQQSRHRTSKHLFEAMIKKFENLHREISNDKMSEMLMRPQDIIERVIFYKKSIQYENRDYLIQISSAYKRLFILAFQIQNPTNVIRLVLSQEKCLEVLNQYSYDFDFIAENIVFRGSTITFKKKLNRENILNGNNIKINKLQKQQQFLKRNFYTNLSKKSTQGQKNLLPDQSRREKNYKTLQNDKSITSASRRKGKFETFEKNNQFIKEQKSQRKITVNSKAKKQQTKLVQQKDIYKEYTEQKVIKNKTELKASSDNTSLLKPGEEEQYQQQFQDQQYHK